MRQEFTDALACFLRPSCPFFSSLPGVHDGPTKRVRIRSLVQHPIDSWRDEFTRPRVARSNHDSSRGQGFRDDISKWLTTQRPVNDDVALFENR